MVKIEITSKHLVTDLSFLEGKKVHFTSGSESWSMNNQDSSKKEYIAEYRNGKFNLQLVASETFSWWAGDMANYGTPASSQSEKWRHEAYEYLISQCDFEMCNISRTLDSIEYSSFFQPAQNEWQNEEGEWEGDEDGDSELHNAVLNALNATFKTEKN